MESDLVTGYFRYTDIWFEWHGALPNVQDRSPLKAFIAHDALTHPDHPLRMKGEDGIILYMGTLPSGECRLLFSSAQVDYMRYWLHAMGLTKEIISLPYSDCLLTAASLRSVSPVKYKNGGELRTALRAIDKNNKRLKSIKGANVLLNARRDMFEKVRTLWSCKVGTWFALDFEAWDRDHSLLTEFGWSAMRWEDGREVSELGHLIVGERRGYTSTYVRQWRDKYNFGKSEDVDKFVFKERIQGLLARYRTQGPLFLVFHDSGQDIKYLTSNGVGVQLDGLSYALPATTPKSGLFVVDTTEMFAALEGEGTSRRQSLQTVCKHLRIDTAFLHNAGNDAHYTMLAMKSMASGDPLDIQREKRWPSSNGPGNTGVKVQFASLEEEDSDSDLPGVKNLVSGYDPDTGYLNDGKQ